MNRICKQFRYLGAWLILMGSSSCSGYDPANLTANQSQSQTSVGQFRHLQLAGNQLDARSSQSTQPSNSVTSVLSSTAVSENTLTVAVYKVDNLCQSLKPETVTGPDNQLSSQTKLIT